MNGVWAGQNGEFSFFFISILIVITNLSLMTRYVTYEHNVSESCGNNYRNYPKCLYRRRDKRLSQQVAQKALKHGLDMRLWKQHCDVHTVEMWKMYSLCLTKVKMSKACPYWVFFLTLPHSPECSPYLRLFPLHVTKGVCCNAYPCYSVIHLCP